MIILLRSRQTISIHSANGFLSDEKSKRNELKVNASPYKALNDLEQT